MTLKNKNVSPWLICIHVFIRCQYFYSSKIQIVCEVNPLLGSKSTGVSLDTSFVVVGCIVVGGNHDVTIAGWKGVTIGIVQVTCLSRVPSGVVGELGYQVRRCISWVPARLQCCSCRVGGIAIDRISVNVVANLGVGACSCGIGDAAGDLFC